MRHASRRVKFLITWRNIYLRIMLLNHIAATVVRHVVDTMKAK